MSMMYGACGLLGNCEQLCKENRIHPLDFAKAVKCVALNSSQLCRAIHDFEYCPVNMDQEVFSLHFEHLGHPSFCPVAWRPCCVL